MVHPSVPHGKTIRKADPSTIHDKFLVGYQGWFACGGDGEPVGPGHHGWMHWLDAPIPAGGHPHTDLWPDMSEYSPEELFTVEGLKMKSGEPAKLFSSRHPKTVQRHFHWMAMHGVDGAFLQRFASECDVESGAHGTRRIRDEVLDRVSDSAEKEGRVFAIMYDVSSLPADRVQRVLEHDWTHLVRHKRMLESPSYLKEKGMPVVAIWGLGMEHSKHTPELVLAVTAFIRSTTPGGAYIMAGSPTHWRTSSGDADRNPRFLEAVWLSAFDAISPWTVGRFRTEDDADYFFNNNMKPDVELLRQRAEAGHKKIDYIPVVLPGGSGYNLTQGEWGFNDLKRNGGRFLWRQVVNAKRLGVRTMYGAMWDEYDEGTVLMPVVEKKSMLPKSDRWEFMALDEDGYDLPSDWYMRICGFAAEGLRSERQIHETFPSKELQDYWPIRPHYERKSAQDRANDSAQASYEAWLLSQKDDKDEPPPPPYSFEAEQRQAGPSSAAAGPSFSGGPSRQGDPLVNLSSSLAAQHISTPPAPLAQTTPSPPPLPARTPSSRPHPISTDASSSRPPPPPRHPAHQSSGSSTTSDPQSPASNPASGAWPPTEWSSSIGYAISNGSNTVNSILSQVPYLPRTKKTSHSRPPALAHSAPVSSSSTGVTHQAASPPVTGSMPTYPAQQSIPAGPPPPPRHTRPGASPGTSPAAHQQSFPTSPLTASPPARPTSALPPMGSSYPGMRPSSASPQSSPGPYVSTYPGQLSSSSGPPPPPKSPPRSPPYHQTVAAAPPPPPPGPNNGGGATDLSRYSTYTAGSGGSSTLRPPPVPSRRPASAGPSVSPGGMQPPAAPASQGGYNPSYDTNLASSSGSPIPSAEPHLPTAGSSYSPYPPGPGGFAPPSMMPMPSSGSGPGPGPGPGPLPGGYNYGAGGEYEYNGYGPSYGSGYGGYPAPAPAGSGAFSAPGTGFPSADPAGGAPPQGGGQQYGGYGYYP